jgi:integrase
MKERNLKKVDGKWLVDISFMKNGKLKRVCAAFPTKTEAQTHLDVLRNRKAMKRLGFADPDERNGNALFEDFARKFIDRYSTKKRVKTRISHQTALNNLMKSELFNGRKLSDITAETISNYQAGRGVKHPVSANRELSFLKLMLRKAVEWGEIEVNPAVTVEKFREQASRIRVLTDEEAKKLTDSAAPHLKPILAVLLQTGMRKNEVLSLRWEYPGWDTDKDLKSSIVSFKKRMMFIPAGFAKNHKDQEIPLSLDLLELFRSLHEGSKSSLVFGVKDVRRSFRTAMKAAEIKRLRVHDLRRTAASRMIKAGVDVVTVCELLGHSDLKITLRYCHSTSETKREAIEKISQAYSPTRQNLTLKPARRSR